MMSPWYYEAITIFIDKLTPDEPPHPHIIRSRFSLITANEYAIMKGKEFALELLYQVIVVWPLYYKNRYNIQLNTYHLIPYCLVAGLICTALPNFIMLEDVHFIQLIGTTISYAMYFYLYILAFFAIIIFFHRKFIQYTPEAE